MSHFNIHFSYIFYIIIKTCRRIGQGRAGQSRAGHDRTGQDRTGQGRAGQDMHIAGQGMIE